MKKLRGRDALRRQEAADLKAVEARRVLETRIEEAMDRWQGQIEARRQPAPDGFYPELGYMAERVLRLHGVTLV